MVTPAQIFGVSGQKRSHFSEALRSFRKDLESVPGSASHSLEDALDELKRDILVEEIGHGADEDHFRFPPAKRSG